MIFIKQTDSITNSQVFRPRTQFIRPHSQQRPTSVNNFSPHPQRILQKSPTYRQSVEIAPQNQYYIQAKPIIKQKMKLPPTSAKVIPNSHHFGMESLENIRNNLALILEKYTFKFNEEITKQNQQIRKMQKKIQFQSEEIQTKNHVIQTLISKMQRNREADCRANTVQAKKIQDLQQKLKIIIDQIQEEKTLIHQKLDIITHGLINHFAKMFQNAKQIISSFVLKNSKKIAEINQSLSIITNKSHKKIIQLQGELQNLQLSIKCYEEINAKDSCSQINISKETASHNSSTSSNKQKNDDLFLSDYFFHPSQTDNPSFKMIEELARQRQKLHQLPIRVYLDSFRRLKYFESRTFIFDRKGNFCTPTQKEIVLLEQKGWIKVVAQ